MKPIVLGRQKEGESVLILNRLSDTEKNIGRMRVASNKVKDIIHFFKSELRPYYNDENELNGIIRWVFAHYLGFSQTDMLIRLQENVNQSDLLKLYFACKKLKQQVPLQYVLGETCFLNLNVHVGPGVLIPRPETEELVDRLGRENKALSSLRILDMGCGSGCIALGIKSLLPDAKVTAWDISADALRFTRQNAKKNNLEIEIEEVNMLDIPPAFLKQEWDIVVSNPPYVCEKERDQMSSHVKDHEPALALFVPDEDALLFYRHIAAYAAKTLVPGGKVYLEINTALGEETMQCLREAGLINCSLDLDMQGKPRFVMAEKRK